MATCTPMGHRRSDAVGVADGVCAPKRVCACAQHAPSAQAPTIKGAARACARRHCLTPKPQTHTHRHTHTSATPRARPHSATEPAPACVPPWHAAHGHHRSGTSPTARACSFELAAGAHTRARVGSCCSAPSRGWGHCCAAPVLRGWHAAQQKQRRRRRRRRRQRQRQQSGACRR